MFKVFDPFITIRSLLDIHDIDWCLSCFISSGGYCNLNLHLVRSAIGSSILSVSFEWTPSESKPGSDFWPFNVFQRHDWIRSFVYFDRDSRGMSDVYFKLNDVSAVLASKGFCITWDTISTSSLEHSFCSESELGWWFVRSTGDVLRLITCQNQDLACSKDALVYQM